MVDRAIKQKEKPFQALMARIICFNILSTMRACVVFTTPIGPREILSTIALTDFLSEINIFISLRPELMPGADDTDLFNWKTAGMSWNSCWPAIVAGAVPEREANE
jgi:hypothetical protein